MPSGFDFGMDNSANRLIHNLLLDPGARGRNVDDRCDDSARSATVSGDDVRMLDALLAARARRLREIALELLDE